MMVLAWKGIRVQMVLGNKWLYKSLHLNKLVLKGSLSVHL